MIGGTNNGRVALSTVSLRHYAALLLAMLLPLTLTACGVFTTPDTPANQRYWHDLYGLVVLRWDASANASSYTIHRTDRGCPWSTTNAESGPCILQRESGEYLLIKCPDSEESRCTILRRSGENEPLSCSEFARLRCSILVQNRSPLEIGETRSTTASVNVGRLVPGFTSASPAFFVTACNLRGCSEIDPANPAQVLHSPDGPAPSVPTGVKAGRARSSVGDTEIQWDAEDGATYYELWKGGALPSVFRLEEEIPDSGWSYDFDDDEFRRNSKIKAIDSVISGLFGITYTTSWKVRACNKAGCSPFSKIVTVER